MRQLPDEKDHREQPVTPALSTMHLTCFMCRLPPISKRHRGIDGEFLNRGFAFQSPAWGRCRLHEVMLRKVFRQQSDQKFLHILQDIRYCTELPLARLISHRMRLVPCSTHLSAWQV